MYRDKVEDILTNADLYHDAYYEAGTFRGPSLYFHSRSLETRQQPESIEHLEYVYATLAAWGMHRMGRGGAKMQSFEIFRQSILPLRNSIAEAQHYDYRQMTEQQWDVLKSIFQGVKVMASGTSLVGNSKVMHHMMPNVVPPIDREYTLRYLHGNTSIQNNLDSEWRTMRNIIGYFFIVVGADRDFLQKANSWMITQDEYPWDTSVFKVIDNLVIGSRKLTSEL